MVIMYKLKGERSTEKRKFIDSKKFCKEVKKNPKNYNSSVIKSCKTQFKKNLNDKSGYNKNLKDFKEVVVKPKVTNVKPKRKMGTHRMPNGVLMTGKTHTKNSKPVKPQVKKVTDVDKLINMLTDSDDE